jgi:hypothetical protein
VKPAVHNNPSMQVGFGPHQFVASLPSSFPG